MSSHRPWKLKAYIGGMYGTVKPTRSFASQVSCEMAADELRRLGWTVQITHRPVRLR